MPSSSPLEAAALSVLAAARDNDMRAVMDLQIATVKSRPQLNTFILMLVFGILGNDNDCLQVARQCNLHNAQRERE
eukprot:4771528-Amphidinium_carterae.2